MIGNCVIRGSNRTCAAWHVRLFLCVFFKLVGVIIAIAEIASSDRNGEKAMTSKIAPWVMEHTANGEQAEFLVVLDDQADLSYAATLPTKVEKGHYVYNALRTRAKTRKRPILQWLRERGLEHRPFYIVNAILMKGKPKIAEALAARPDVARIEGNPHIKNHLPQPSPSDPDHCATGSERWMRWRLRANSSQSSQISRPGRLAPTGPHEMIAPVQAGFFSADADLRFIMTTPARIRRIPIQVKNG